MLEKIRIQGFRQFKDITIDGLGRINFILGDNNAGKTTILEAIYTWASGQKILHLLRIPLSRGRYSVMQTPYWVMEELLSMACDPKNIPLTMKFSGLFNGQWVNFDHEIYPSEILCEYDTSYKNLSNLIGSRTNSVLMGETGQAQNAATSNSLGQQTTIAKWTIKHEGKIIDHYVTFPFRQISEGNSFHPVVFIDYLSHVTVSDYVTIYAALKRGKLLEKYTEQIKKAFPEIEGFDMVPYPDGSQAPISVIKDDKLLPIYAYGDGIQRWFYIMGALTLRKNSIICIDEIDVGLHHDAQAEFSVNLVKYAIENGVQLFITTHNIEFVENFLQAIQESEMNKMDPIRVITIKKKNDAIKLRSLSATEALRGLNDFNLELR